MTKKDKILKIFNDADWLESPSGQRVKTLGYYDFLNAGLNQTIEYGETYCDVIYARKILTKMGYKVLVGMSFHVYEKNSNQNSK